MTLKYNMLMYEKIFQILKNKIESGLLPAGSVLPSRADLCLELKASEKTIRRALVMLEKEGYIKTSQGKLPVVTEQPNKLYFTTTLAPKEIDLKVTNDVLKTGMLLCYPVIKNGISLCEQSDLEIPRKILENMNYTSSAEFWDYSKCFLRFFIARNENALILHAAKSLGLSNLRPLQDSPEIRSRYYEQLWELMRTLECGGNPESVHFDDMSEIYGLTRGDRPAFKVSPESAVLLGTKHLEKQLQGADIRYSAIYMDILGLIAAGHYKRGDRLPSHKELQKIYGVSVDTTLKAIQFLQRWGVVTATRGKGIIVEMDENDIKKVHIPPQLIACHVRRYLDTLMLLTLTIERAASCAVTHISHSEFQTVKAEIMRQWNEDYVYERTPAILLDLITRHIGLEAFSAIYKFLQNNFRIGRSIPGLLNSKKTPINSRVHEHCMEVLEALSAGNSMGFINNSVQLFEEIQRLVTEECKRLGYYDAAIEVYDGAELWK